MSISIQNYKTNHFQGYSFKSLSRLINKIYWIYLEMSSDVSLHISLLWLNYIIYLFSLYWFTTYYTEKIYLWDINHQTKVSKFISAIQSYQDVFQFNVKVNQVMIMQMLHSLLKENIPSIYIFVTALHLRRYSHIHIK